MTTTYSKDDDKGRCAREKEALIDLIVKWLADVGYGFDWHGEVRLPDPFRQPLAFEYWLRDGDPSVTVDDMAATLDAEGPW